MRIALVGVGKMGEAVLAGLAAVGVHEVVVVNRRAERDAELVQRYGVTAATLSEAVAGSDVVVVAVKPKDVPGMLDELSPALTQQAVVVSLAAGITLQTMQQHLPAGAAAVRAMPNTPSLVGQGMSAASPGEHVDDEQLQRVLEVLAACGKAIVVPEDQQDGVTAVSGSGPAYIFAVAEAMIEAGVQLGLPRDVATVLANQTILGAGTMLTESGTHPSILRENVTSPGGTTAQALKVLDQRAVRAAFAEAMQACHDRSAAMG
ncbi:MAG: pyrroline-5-carboxylate reductase [Luteococcus sp.]|uniref:pyrroline-5-carboxylate reductase n=1 Tax=Luteococcus sp. TaxID=1969402 RepID=UPI002647313D|nr:pyrroline-5-carboxylate reductase [Luteococcus sp.]MDN5562734.1 pyrroline-5-carboxylate reductase [Luteococcus sp.]